MKSTVGKLFLFLILVINATNMDVNDSVVKKLYVLAKSHIDFIGDTAPTIYPATSVDMQLIKVSDHVYYAQGEAGTATDNEGFISNAGVIVTDQGVVLFDTLGTPSLGHLLLQKIREITDKPIIKVIISHYHTDHFYGLQVFKDMGAEVIATKGGEQYLQSDAVKNLFEERKKSLKPWVNQFPRLIAPDTTINGQSDFTVGGVTFQLTPVGKNHAPGDLVMRVLPDNVLFVGDLVFEQRLPFVVGSDSKKWLETLDNLDISHINVIVPGHGAASTHPKKTLRATREYLNYVRRTMQKVVENIIPFDEAYNVDWSKYQYLPAFEKANRINAYSVYLSLEAESMDNN